ncbi:hypothetical protein PXV97_11675 [Citrobacter freundii]|nr:hypothetical protein PXV97_11675 [Citrobacter freundii]
MKFIPIALLLISTPLWAANSTNTNVLTVKAELVTGSCDITASDVDLGDLDASEFAAGGAWANLSATTKGNVPTQPLKISFRCDSGSLAKTLVLSFKPQKAQLTGNQIFPNEYTGPMTAAGNVGVVVFEGEQVQLLLMCLIKTIPLPSILLTIKVQPLPILISPFRLVFKKWIQQKRSLQVAY